LRFVERDQLPRYDLEFANAQAIGQAAPDVVAAAGKAICRSPSASFWISAAMKPFPSTM